MHQLRLFEMLVGPLRRLLRIRRCANLDTNELQRAPMVGLLDEQCDGLSWDAAANEILKRSAVDNRLIVDCRHHIFRL